MTFGNALKSARNGKMTQQQLADAVGVKQSSIAQAETGKIASLAALTVARIERALGLTAGELAQHLPDDHRAHDLLQSEVPDRGVVWASAPDEEGLEPEPGKVFKLVGRYPPGTVVLRVRGDQIRAWHILEGDVIAVRPTEQPEDGSVVVARVGNTHTLKAFLQGRLYSFPQDAKVLTDLVPSEPCQVIGVMIEIVSGQRRLTPQAKPKGPSTKSKKK